MAQTIADQSVEILERAGVERVWGLPGDSLNAFTDALRTSDIAWMHVRHEEAAAFAAAAEAEITGELAVVAGSCGPGNLHFINGLFDAHRSRVPVLAMKNGQVLGRLLVSLALAILSSLEVDCSRSGRRQLEVSPLPLAPCSPRTAFLTHSLPYPVRRVG